MERLRDDSENDPAAIKQNDKKRSARRENRLAFLYRISLNENIDGS